VLNKKSKKNLKFDSKGLTLIEFIIYSVVVTVMVAAMVFTGINVIQSRARIQVIDEVNRNGETAIRAIERYVRMAEGINSPENPGTFNNFLSLKVLEGGKNPTIFEVDEHERLTISRGGETPAPITSNRVRVLEDELEFTNISYSDSLGTIRVQMTISHKSPLGRDEYDLQRTFYTTVNLIRE